MACAVARQLKIASCCLASAAAKQAVDVVVVASDALSLAAQLSPALKLSVLAVEDDNRVPECPLGIDGDDVADGQRQIGHVLCQVELAARDWPAPLIRQAARILWISRRMLIYYRDVEKPIPRSIWLACLSWKVTRPTGRQVTHQNPLRAASRRASFQST